MIRIGVLSRVHGIRGALFFHPDLEGSETILACEALSVGKDATALRSLEVESIRPNPSGFLIQLKGIGDRDAAETLKGLSVFVPRSALPPLEEGEFFADDLIGLSVRTPDGQTVGVVAQLIDTGGVPVLEVVQDERSWQIPLADPFIERIDTEAGYVIATPIDEEAIEG